jgi:hypothetical protein
MPLHRLEMLIVNATAPLNAPLRYPRWLSAELVAELPRRKQDAMAISGTYYPPWPANISEAILQVNVRLTSLKLWGFRLRPTLLLRNGSRRCAAGSVSISTHRSINTMPSLVYRNYDVWQL